MPSRPAHRRLIRMFTFVGDTVLDPFLGSGITSLAAQKESRNSIGYEINEDYLPLIEEKLQFQKGIREYRGGIDIVEPLGQKDDVQEEIRRLPYIFRDPIKFDKKVDPRTRPFGSKIDHQQGQREKYFSIEKILVPTLLRLNTGQTIRLLGVRENPQKTVQAMHFLRDKTKGQKVYLKFDIRKEDSQDGLLCYLYLKNKTFINAHLIKKGLALPDTRHEYVYQSKFFRLVKIEIPGEAIAGQ